MARAGEGTVSAGASPPALPPLRVQPAHTPPTAARGLLGNVVLKVCVRECACAVPTRGCPRVPGEAAPRVSAGSGLEPGAAAAPTADPSPSLPATERLRNPAGDVWGAGEEASQEDEEPASQRHAGRRAGALGRRREQSLPAPRYGCGSPSRRWQGDLPQGQMSSSPQPAACTPREYPGLPALP